MRINLHGQDEEGISEIRPDGTIVYREREMRVLRAAFGYDCKEMHVNDVDDWAADLQARYRAFTDQAAA